MLGFRPDEKQSTWVNSVLVFQLSPSPQVGGLANAVCFRNLGTVHSKKKVKSSCDLPNRLRCRRSVKTAFVLCLITLLRQIKFKS